MKNSYSLNLGLILAAVSIVIFLVGVIADGGMIFGISTLILAIAIMVMLSIRTLKKQRADQSGFLTFGEGFKTAIIGLAISGVIYILFTYVYANFLDSGYIDRTVEKSLEMTLKFMQGNVSEDIIETTLVETERATREGFTLAGIAKTFGWSMLFYAVLSLIFAASMKKNPEA